MKKILYLLIITLAIQLIFNSCGHIEPLPTASEAEQGDTSYVQIFPNWNKNKYNFNSPKDVLIGRDGYLYIADSANHRVVVIDQAGNEILEDEYGNNFQGLSEINFDTFGKIQPIRLGQDSKMNLLMVDGGNRIFAWNQHYNNTGINGVATKIAIRDDENNDIKYIHKIDSLIAYLNDGFSLLREETEFENNEKLIDSLLAPHIFFNGNDKQNILLDTYGDPRNIKITDLVAFGKDYNNGIYILDKRYNRIVKLRYIPQNLLRLGDSSIVINYKTIFDKVVTGQGTGAGFVMEPRSIDMDVSGNLYYTQTDGVYSCHGISAGTYRSIFIPGEDDILELDRFGSAWDVNFSKDGIIYIVDAKKNYVQTFNNNGKFLRNIGTILSADSSSDSSAVPTKIGNILDRPESIAVKDNIIYIADTGNDRIVRYQYVILSEQNLEDYKNYQY